MVNILMMYGLMLDIHKYIYETLWDIFWLSMELQEFFGEQNLSALLILMTWIINGVCVSAFTSAWSVFSVCMCVCVGGIHTLGSLKCKVTGLFNFWMWNIYLGKSAALGERGRKRREKRDKLKQKSKGPLMNCIKTVCSCSVTYVLYSFSLPELF